MKTRELAYTTSFLAMLAGTVSPVAAQVQPPVAGQARTTADATTDATDEDGEVNAQERAAEKRSSTIAGRPVASQSDDKEIIVTGSRIVRPNAQASSPVTTVTSQEIEQQGTVNIEEVLNRLPQVTPDLQSTYNDGVGTQKVKLRRLDFNRTLTLVDGQRLASSEAVDLNIIPGSLVDRVDVLSGGASSVYGSDAVAGVINFILKRNYKGVRIDGNYGFYNHQNREQLTSAAARNQGFGVPGGNRTFGGRANLSATFGDRYFDDKLSLMGFVTYRAGTPIPYGAIDYSACELTQATRDGAPGCSVSTYSQFGYITPRSGANAGRALVNARDGTRTFTPYNASYAYNAFKDFFYGRKYDRLNGGGFVNLKLDDAAEIYANYIWMRSQSYNQYSPPRIFPFSVYGSDPFLVNCDNPLLSAGQRQTLCGAAAGTDTRVPLDIRYRFEGAGGQRVKLTNLASRVTGGIRGEIAEGWRYDAGGVYTWSGNKYTGPVQIADFDKINRALNVVNVNGVPTCVAKVNGQDPKCAPLDVFRAYSADPAVMSYLYDGNTGTSLNVSKLIDFTANITGDLGKMGLKSPFAKEGVAFAAGIEYREDRQGNSANPEFRTQNGGEDFTGRQSVREVNAELQVPLVEDRFVHLVQVNGGYRLSKYSTNPNTFDTWKVEGLFAPVPDITFRISRNKAQRAPTIYENNQTISFDRSGVGNDPCATDVANNRGPRASLQQCVNTGLAAALYGSPTLNCPDGQCVSRFGGFVLDPENAKTLTYGLVLQPTFLRGLTISADRYQIKIDNQIGFNFGDFAIDGCLATGNAYYCDRIVRNADGTLFGSVATGTKTGFVQAGTTNQYKLEASGWDFQAQYGLNLGGKTGRLDIDFNGSLTTYSGGQDSVTVLAKNCAGYYGPRCGGAPIPKWGHNMRATYTTSDGVFNASFNWRYTGPTTITYNSTEPGIGYGADDRRTTFNRLAPWSFFDLAMGFNVTKDFTWRVSVNNIFDRSPPVIPSSYDVALSRSNSIPARYDPFGRNIAISLGVGF